MKIQLLLSLFAILLLQITGTSAIEDDDDHIVPIHYDLFYKFFLPEDNVDENDNYTFDGISRITMYPNKDHLHEFDVDTKALNISHVSLKLIKIYGIDQTPMDIKLTWSVSSEKDELLIKPNKPLRLQQTFELTIEFSGEIDDVFLDGKYDVPNSDDDDYIAIGPIGPDEAHELFPCFDDPKLKATFTIEVEHHQSYNVWSNSLPLQTTDLVNTNRVTKIFKKTPPISTYLVVILIAELEQKPVPHTNITVIAREEVMSKTEYAVKVATSVLKEFEKYTGIPYSSFNDTEKLDLVFSPIHIGESVEKWGMIIFDEHTGLYDEHDDDDDDDDKMEIVMAVTEEISNIWFGNLVTCESWDYSWLNEAFGEYFKYFLPNDAFSKKEMETLFILQEVHHSLLLDSLADASPISNASPNSKLNSAAKYLRDSKGPVILRSIANIMGEQNFQNGIRKYLENNKYNTSTPDKLINALNEYWPHKEIQLKDILNDLFNKPGFPLVTLQLYENGTAFTIKQERFHDDYPGGPTDAMDKSLQWIIPLSYTTNVEKDFKQTEPKVFLKWNEFRSIELDKQADWIIANIRHTGYYKVNYDGKTWYKLIKALKSENFGNIDEINRAQLVFDVFSLLTTNLSNKRIAFDLAEYLENEYSPLCWDKVYYFLVNSYSYLPLEYHQKAKEINLKLVKNVYDKLGFKTGKNESPTDTRFKNIIRILACFFGHSECISTAKIHFDDYIKNNKTIPFEYRYATYCSVVGIYRGEYFEFLFEKFKNQGGNIIDWSPFYGLTCVNDEKFTWKILDYIFMEIPESSRYRAFEGFIFSSDGNNKDDILSYIKNHFDKIAKMHLMETEVKSLIDGSDVWCRTEKQLKEWEQIFKDNKETLAEIKDLDINKNLEEMKNKILYYRPFVTAYIEYLDFDSNKEVISASDMEETFIIAEVQLALKFDSTDKGVSLTKPDVNRDRIRDSKGPAIIRQMVHIMGEDNFQKGIRQYLSLNKYETATPDELIDALDDFWPHDKVEIREVFNDFTTQPGYPLVTLSLSEDGKSFTAKQGRYYDNEGEDETAEVDKSLQWKIALSYTTNLENDFKETGPEVFLDEGEVETIELNHEAEWVIGNIRQTGYFRVNYDEDTWDKLIVALKSEHFGHIPEIDRCQLVSNALALVATDLPDKQILFELLEYMEKEDSMICWMNVAPAFIEIDKYLDDKYHDLSDKFIGGLIKNIYEELGFKKTKKSEPYLETQLRMFIRSLACSVELEECVKDAKEEFDEFIANGKPIDRELQHDVFCTMIEHDDKKYFDTLFNKVKTQFNSSGYGLMHVLACEEDEKLLWEVLDYIFKSAPKEDRLSLFRRFAFTGAANDAVISYIKNNFNTIRQALDESDLETLIESGEYWCTTEEQFKELEDIIEDNKEYLEGIKDLDYLHLLEEIKDELEYNDQFVDAYEEYLDPESTTDGASKLSFSTMNLFMFMIIFVISIL